MSNLLTHEQIESIDPAIIDTLVDNTDGYFVKIWVETENENGFIHITKEFESNDSNQIIEDIANFMKNVK